MSWYSYWFNEIFIVIPYTLILGFLKLFWTGDNAGIIFSENFHLNTMC